MAVFITRVEGHLRAGVFLCALEKSALNHKKKNLGFLITPGSSACHGVVWLLLGLPGSAAAQGGQHWKGSGLPSTPDAPEFTSVAQDFADFFFPLLLLKT